MLRLIIAVACMRQNAKSATNIETIKKTTRLWVQKTRFLSFSSNSMRLRLISAFSSNSVCICFCRASRNCRARKSMRASLRQRTSPKSLIFQMNCRCRRLLCYEFVVRYLDEGYQRLRRHLQSLKSLDQHQERRRGKSCESN